MKHFKLLFETQITPYETNKKKSAKPILIYTQSVTGSGVQLNKQLGYKCLLRRDSQGLQVSLNNTPLLQGEEESICGILNLN